MTPGAVAQWTTRRRRPEADACDADNLCSANAVLVTAAGGEDWPQLVDRAVREDWTGVAALAAYPGTVADAVTHNHAAYGESVGDVIWSVRTWDRHDRTHRTFAAVDCEFRPGGSRFTSNDGDRRYDVLEVSFLFGRSPRPSMTKACSRSSMAYPACACPSSRSATPCLRVEGGDRSLAR